MKTAATPEPASGLPDGGAPPGTVLEDVELLDASGAATTLFTALGRRTGVLVLYRGAWCPYCDVALSTYQAHLLPELTARGVALLAISPQTPDGSLSMQEKHDLAFGVLSDPGSALAGRLGVHPDYTTRTEPAAVLAALQRAGL